VLSQVDRSEDRHHHESGATALAVAMATRPRLLLADEPTSRLDADSRDRLLDLLVEVTDRHRIAVLIVTHDTVVADRMQRMIHLRDGRIAEEANDSGRYSVIGADGSIQLPDDAASRGWVPGSLVSIDMHRDREIHITLAE
jgi:putative ABC transport system ATP-binding protein